jgi:large subunit ribosomal protein L3
MKGLIGKKLGMTRVFDEDGRSVPVTVLQCGPCPITQVKTPEKEGYAAVQIGFGEDRSEKHLTKPQLGHLAKAGVKPMRLLREFRVDSTEGLEAGQMLTVEIFEGVNRVNVTGFTKGRGFAGVVKRHGFGGGKDTHGSNHHRHAGTIGMHQFPGHVFKGHGMAGRYGSDRQTVTNMRVIRVDRENNLLFVKGSVPGATHGYIFVQEPRR